MAHRYTRELSRLGETYRRAMESDLGVFEDLVAKLRRGPAIFVGSGGGYAVARLAADVHQHSVGQLALATTPLHLIAMPTVSNATVVLFSASARHPDAILAVEAALKLSSSVALVTRQRRDRIPVEVARPGVDVVAVPSPKDGFLATNSVLAMAVAICRAYGYDLPKELPSPTGEGVESLRSECLVLYGPRQRSVALDLEARLAETGLSWTQCADLRNFAHGRHVGFARRLEQVSVVVLVTPADRELAERTIALLPTETHVVTLETDLEYPASVLDLLVASMRLVGVSADGAGMDPGRPGVAPFGRKLYHLSARRLLGKPKHGPVDRKVAAAGLSRRERPVVAEALERWCADARNSCLGTLVLDYDGTCCHTDERFGPPPAGVARSLVGLLERGLGLAFASGRGRSLGEAVSQWIPETYWPEVHLGPYNGTVLMRLSDSLEGAHDAPEGPLAEAADRLLGLRAPYGIEIEPRRTQVSVTSRSLSGVQLLSVVQALLARAPALDCKAVASGHSVDVMDADASKGALTRMLTSTTGREVLAIGDQGQPGGNDFDLLASTRWSLTVDLCSPDLTRCWNLDTEGMCGPELLVRYLDALEPHDDGTGFRFAWSRL